MPTYVQVTLAEFKDLLKTEKGWRETDPHAHEYVFEFPLKSFDGAVVKVFTTVNKRNEAGRKCGGDSIKVCAVHIPTKRGLVSAIRVFRTAGWQDRVKTAVLEVIELAKKRRWIISAPPKE